MDRKQAFWSAEGHEKPLTHQYRLYVKIKLLDQAHQCTLHVHARHLNKIEKTVPEYTKTHTPAASPNFRQRKTMPLQRLKLSWPFKTVSRLARLWGNLKALAKMNACRGQRGPSYIHVQCTCTCKPMTLPEVHCCSEEHVPLKDFKCAATTVVSPQLLPLFPSTTTAQITCTVVKKQYSALAPAVQEAGCRAWPLDPLWSLLPST